MPNTAINRANITREGKKTLISTACSTGRGIVPAHGGGGFWWQVRGALRNGMWLLGKQAGTSKGMCAPLTPERDVVTLIRGI